MSSSHGDLPNELLVALASCRPICPRFSKTGRCKHGRKCKMKHEGEDQEIDVTSLPYTAPHTLNDGSVYIVSRPPLAEAWKQWFSEHNCPVRLHQGEEWRLPDGQKAIRYLLQNVVPSQDPSAVAAATVSGGVHVQTCDGNIVHLDRKPGFDGGTYWMAHGTSIANGLIFLRCGQLMAAEPGKLGAGIYSIQLEGDMRPDIQCTLQDAWERSAKKGHNCGCLILFQAKGVVVNRMPSSHIYVPPGAIAHEEDECCTSGSGIQPAYIMFLMDAVVDVIGEQLDRMGYTKKYHDTVLQAEKLLHEKRVQAGKQKQTQQKRCKQGPSSVFGSGLHGQWLWMNGELHAKDEAGRFWSANAWALFEYRRQQRQVNEHEGCITKRRAGKRSVTAH